MIPYLLASDYRRHGSYQIAADSHTGRRDIQYDALHRMGLQSREPYVIHATLAPTLTRPRLILLTSWGITSQGCRQNPTEPQVANNQKPTTKIVVYTRGEAVCV